MPATFTAPGPGLWERDAAHEPRPLSPYFRQVFLPEFDTALRRTFSDYGLLLDRFDHRIVNGWLYMRPRPVGAPEKPGGLPPKPVFKLLLHLHPELRRRKRAAARALADRSWRAELAHWHGGGRERMHSQGSVLQKADPRALDDAALCDHIAEVNRFVAAGMAVHFRHTVLHWISVGDWLRRTAAWTGAEPSEAFAALRGGSPASVRPVELLDRVAARVRETPEAVAVVQGDDPAGQRLDRLRACSGELAAALDAYLEEYGSDLVTGFDLDDYTTAELPETILAGVEARLRAADGPESPDGPATADEVAARLRARVPAEARSQFDELLAEARDFYGLRDDDVHLAFQRPFGLLRRALLAAGTRLAERGSLVSPEHVFEARPAEVDALLGAAGQAPEAGELAGRAEQRRRNALLHAPLRLGEDEGPPPLGDWLTPALARINDALMFALSLEDSESSSATPQGTGRAREEKVQGLGASGGRYEGRARLILAPADFDRIEHGDILVARITTPAYNVVLPLIGAVVTDRGGLLSHPAIVAREYGIPAVVGAHDATARIADGARIVVDGDTGTVHLL